LRKLRRWTITVIPTSSTHAHGCPPTTHAEDHLEAQAARRHRVEEDPVVRSFSPKGPGVSAGSHSPPSWWRTRQHTGTRHCSLPVSTGEYTSTPTPGSASRTRSCALRFTSQPAEGETGEEGVRLSDSGEHPAAPGRPLAHDPAITRAAPRRCGPGGSGRPGRPLSRKRLIAPKWSGSRRRECDRFWSPRRTRSRMRAFRPASVTTSAETPSSTSS
jgi:hypothetical protein